MPPEVAEEERRRQTVNTAVAEVPCSTGWCSKVRPVGAVQLLNYGFPLPNINTILLEP